ncbi:MAG: hypothetical protein ACI8ZB_004012 [Desulforhopalus sp.]|jgi:hypothetical protein
MEHHNKPIIVLNLSATIRQNQKFLTNEARSHLANKIKQYIESDYDPVAQHHSNGHVHGTLNFLPWHRGFLKKFDEWQRAESLENNTPYVALAYWVSSETIPVEVTHEGRNDEISMIPVPNELLTAGGLLSLNFEEFTRILESHHDDVHIAIGGDMANPDVSPKDPIFWMFHSFYDHLYANWQTVHAEAKVKIAT